MTAKQNHLENSKEIAKKIAQLMFDKKALDILLLDVRSITTLTDFFVICTSESDPQTRAISNHVEDELTANGIKPWHIEGYEHLEWVLLDYVNIVAQVFSRDAREYYDFERLWADAKITKIKE